MKKKNWPKIEDLEKKSAFVGTKSAFVFKPSQNLKKNVQTGGRKPSQKVRIFNLACTTEYGITKTEKQYIFMLMRSV